MRKFVAYLRVSTSKQGVSGLGLDAQNDSINKFTHRTECKIIKTFKEVESGKKSFRPQLQEAIDLCEKEGASLLIAKLDRLSREVFFIQKLKKSGLKFVCADMPDATELTIDILSAVANEELRKVSTRTVEALAVAKKKGVKLGANNKIVKGALTKAIPKRIESQRKNQRRYVEFIGKHIKRWQKRNFSVKDMTEELIAMKVPTPRGSFKWQRIQVYRILKLMESA